MVSSSRVDSRVFTADDWLNSFSAEGSADASSDQNDLPNQSGFEDSAATDEPPDRQDGSPKGEDVEAVLDRRQNRALREKYADKAYGLAQVCLFGWAGMLVASGLVNGVRGESLWSDKVIIAVTTGVTVSVLAAFLGVIRGLFPNGNGDKK